MVEENVKYSVTFNRKINFLSVGWFDYVTHFIWRNIVKITFQAFKMYDYKVGKLLSWPLTRVLLLVKAQGHSHSLFIDLQIGSRTMVFHVKIIKSFLIFFLKTIGVCSLFIEEKNYALMTPNSKKIEPLKKIANMKFSIFGNLDGSRFILTY